MGVPPSGESWSRSAGRSPAASKRRETAASASTSRCRPTATPPVWAPRGRDRREAPPAPPRARLRLRAVVPAPSPPAKSSAADAPAAASRFPPMAHCAGRRTGRRRLPRRRLGVRPNRGGVERAGRKADGRRRGVRRRPIRLQHRAEPDGDTALIGGRSDAQDAGRRGSPRAPVPAGHSRGRS